MGAVGRCRTEAGIGAVVGCLGVEDLGVEVWARGEEGFLRGLGTGGVETRGASRPSLRGGNTETLNTSITYHKTHSKHTTGTLHHCISQYNTQHDSILSILCKT